MGLFLQNHLSLCSIHVSWLSRDLNSPKSSDSNRHVSPTPTLRHQAKKLAVLSRAKNEPEGALCRHGILREGTLCKRHREVSTRLQPVLQENHVSRRVFAFWMTVNAAQTCAYSDKNTSTRLAWAAQPQYFYQNTALHSFNLLWFLFHLLRLWFQHRIKDRFPHRSIWEMAEKKSGPVLPALQWFGIKWHAYGLFQPPTQSAQGDLYTLLWFYTGYVRLCNEKGAMSSCWKHAGFCGYFSFLSRQCFRLFWDTSCR